MNKPHDFFLFILSKKVIILKIFLPLIFLKGEVECVPDEVYKIERESYSKPGDWDWHHQWDDDKLGCEINGSFQVCHLHQLEVSKFDIATGEDEADGKEKWLSDPSNIGNVCVPKDCQGIVILKRILWNIRLRIRYKKHDKCEIWVGQHDYHAPKSNEKGWMEQVPDGDYPFYPIIVSNCLVKCVYTPLRHINLQMAILSDIIPVICSRSLMLPRKQLLNQIEYWVRLTPHKWMLNQ